MDKMIWPMLTRATVPFGLPQAPRIPVCNLSAPAQDNILLIRTTWYGWARTRRWKASFPAVLTMYLLDVMLASISSKIRIHAISRISFIFVASPLPPNSFLLSTSSFRVELTCWRKYGRLPKPRNSIVHTRWKPSECREGTRRHLPSYDRDRRYESLGREHHGWIGTLGKAMKRKRSVLIPLSDDDSAIVNLALFHA